VDAYAPVDTAWSRSIVQNVMHSADSCGQVLVNWRTSNANAASRVLTQANTWYAVLSFAALPIRLRGDGTSYPLRIRLRAASDGPKAMDFAVCVVGGRLTTDAGYDAISVGSPLATFGASSTATHAWLTLTSGTINLSAGTGSTTEIERSTLAEIGGAAVGVRYDAAKVLVFAKSASSGTCYVSGLHAAEYIGL